MMFLDIHKLYTSTNGYLLSVFLDNSSNAIILKEHVITPSFFVAKSPEKIGVFGGGCGIRTHVGLLPNGFQDFLESWSVQVTLWRLGSFQFP